MIWFLIIDTLHDVRIQQQHEPKTPHLMPLIDWLAALLVISLWGINFVIIKVGLNDFPPLLLGALRFAAVAFPAIFFIKRPQIPLKLLLTYGLAISFGQFAFLFTAL